eukprot:COSAG01_NODE_9786_length_2343_cov_9.324866_3_plen_121_part_00
MQTTRGSTLATKGGGGGGEDEAGLRLPSRNVEEMRRGRRASTASTASSSSTSASLALSAGGGAVGRLSSASVPSPAGGTGTAAPPGRPALPVRDGVLQDGTFSKFTEVSSGLPPHRAHTW